MDCIRVEEVTTAREEYVDAVNHLLVQLTSTPITFTLADLERMVKADSSRLFFVIFEENIVGMLTLGSYLSPTGPKSWVEDVVVDKSYRGHSLGRKLVEYAIDEARKVTGNQLMLTSKPARIAANALYRSSGFLPKETNVYKMSFD